MKNIFIILKHNLKSVMKNWFWLIIIFPLVMGIGFNLLMNKVDNNITKGVSIAVYSNDKSEVFDKLLPKDKFKKIDIKNSPQEVKDIVNNGNAIVGLIIDSNDLYKDIKEGKSNLIEIISKEGSSEKDYVVSIINSYIIQLTSLGDSREESLNYYNKFDSNKYSFNYRGSDLIVVVYYLTTFGLFSMGFLLIAGRGLNPLLKEKENKIDKRILVSKISKVEYILGHILGCFVLLMMQCLTLLIAFMVLNNNFNVGFGWMVLISFALSLIGIAISLLVLSVSNNSTMYYTLLTIVITPISLLSGGFIPIEFMPDMVQKLSLVSPLTWINSAFKKIIMSGEVSGIILDFVASIAISVVLIMLYLLIESRKKAKTE